MNRRIVIVAASVAAVLAGCGSGTSAGPGATAAGTTPVSSLACKQRYLAWEHGPAHADADQFIAAQKGLQAAGSTDKIPAITAAAKTEGVAAARFAHYPVPACADPHGYLAALLGDVQAAAASAGTAKGLPGLVQALAPRKQVPELESEYTAELKRTTGL